MDDANSRSSTKPGCSSFPLVSIIVRSMDRPTLPEALDSIAAQTWPNLEIVVVNAKGPSHLPLPSIWSGRRLRMISSGEKLSRTRAANVGLSDANGDYFGFLDDDDLLFPDHISVLLELLKRDGTSRVAYSGVRVDIYEETSGAVKKTFDFNGPYCRNKLFGRNFIPIHAVVFSSELVKLAGCRFDEQLEILEDWDFWIQLAMLTDFLHCDQITAVYRNRGASGLGGSVGASDIDLRNSTGAVFEKWKKIWTGNDIADIVLYRDSMCEAAGQYISKIEWDYEKKLEHQLAVLNVKQQEIESLMTELEILRVRFARLNASSPENPPEMTQVKFKCLASLAAFFKKLFKC
jgi:glycosyltransferase involved in cell wall biosynthesis